MANRGKKDTYQVQIEINTEEEWNDLCSKVVITNLIKQNILICIKEIILELLVAFDILLRLTRLGYFCTDNKFNFGLIVFV